MSTAAPVLIAPRWRSRRAAAAAGVAFAVLLIAAMVMMQFATAGRLFNPFPRTSRDAA